MLLIEFVAELLKTYGAILREIESQKERPLLLSQLKSFDRSTSAYSQPLLKGFQPIVSQTNEKVQYATLDRAVQSLSLSKDLENHVWSFPPYRTLVEGRFHLNDLISPPSPPQAWLDDFIQNARLWTEKGLGYRGSNEPWLRFRTEVLKKLKTPHIKPV